MAVMLTLIAVAVSCSKNNEATMVLRTPHMPTTPYVYTEANTNKDIPTPWGNQIPTDNTPSMNQTTNAGAALGRVLFYDRVMSLNNSISCGSCHKQSNGFADNAAFSTGFQGKSTSRNSIGIWNAKMNFSFFMDGRAKTLEQQTLMPVKNHIEMGMERVEVLPQKLNSLTYYKQLFKDAYGTEEITKERISFALAQFMRAMASTNSKFDEGAKTNFSNFTELEKNGMTVFSQNRCISCHSGANFNGGWEDYANIGLDENYADKGLMGISSNSFDEGRFKIPSLRNVALTAPYMHDGRFKTLEEVVNHYSDNIKAHPNLDGRLSEGGWGGPTFFEGDFIANGGPTTSFNIGDSTFTVTPVRMHLTDLQKKSLVAFLQTLTDFKYVSDPRFSDPFQ